MQGDKHTRTHSHSVNGHVMRTSTRSRIAHSQWSRDAHAQAHTQANAQEDELSQSSVIRCTQAHKHALPCACALNVPEAYFYYYSCNKDLGSRGPLHKVWPRRSYSVDMLYKETVFAPTNPSTKHCT